MKIDQRIVDKIVARAQNSECGLGNPEKGPSSYQISQYGEHPDLASLAMLLVNAHFSKYDIISVFAAALEEVERIATDPASA